MSCGCSYARRGALVIGVTKTTGNNAPAGVNVTRAPSGEEVEGCGCGPTPPPTDFMNQKLAALYPVIQA
jgi:hypothetical protein